MQHLFGSIGPLQLLFLALALLFAFGFEFVNGFHDTANAVATVIYTHTLPPYVAVVWSGIWNLIGVLTSNGAVAFSVVALLPVELVLNVNSAAGFAMIFALLVSAIVWNVGTWAMGLPASSSHTLIGAIMGVGLMNSVLNSGGFMGGVNWAKAKDVGLSLLISPIVGFIGTALLFLLLKSLVRNATLYTPPERKKAPPLWVRGILCLTCTGVSFAHGSNDGQKGMGLIMLILIGIVPGMYALDMSVPPAAVRAIEAQAHAVSAIIAKQSSAPVMADPAKATKILTAYLKNGGAYNTDVLPALAEKNQEIAAAFDAHTSFSEIPEAKRGSLRVAFYSASSTISKLNKYNVIANAADAKVLSGYKDALEKKTKYIPFWVQLAVAISLGFGTMIGWKRIVVTVGEKIGKSHLTYAQGATAELVAMITIGLADRFGLPVSTTHVLSSGIAGSMAANYSGLQGNTLRNILLAWVLTLPACMFLGAMFFAGALVVLAHVFGIH